MKIGVYILIVGTMIGFSGCGDNLFGLINETTESTTTQSSIQQYNGPGSKWELALHDYASFTLREEESFAISLSGDYAINSEGFYKLSVTTSTNPSLSVTQAYLLQIPDVLIISQPLVNDTNYSQLITMIPSGICHNTNISNNWIDIKRDINSSTEPIFGTFISSYENATASLANRFDIISAELGEGNLSTINCNQGLANLTDGRAYMHSSGNSILHTGLATPDDESDDSFLVSIPSQDISGIADLADEYIGFVYDGVLNQTSPISMTVLSNGTGVGYKYTDVDNGVLDTSSPINLLVNQVNQPLDGFVNLGLNGAQSRCVFHSNLSDSGKKVLLCTGDNPTDPGVGNIYTMLAISK